jgi:hypothetical protein
VTGKPLPFLFVSNIKVCYWALLFMPLVILHHLLNVFVQLANKRDSQKNKKTKKKERKKYATLQV